VRRLTLRNRSVGRMTPEAGEPAGLRLVRTARRCRTDVRRDERCATVTVRAPSGTVTITFSDVKE